MFNVGPRTADPSTLERQAHRINDPVERLRYLRRNAPASLAPVTEVEAPQFQVADKPRRWPFVAAAFAVCLVAGGSYLLTLRGPRPAPVKAASVPSPGPTPNQIWQVATSQTEEVYSNGLRIDLSYATKNRPRAEYPVFAINGGSRPVGTGNKPIGIVYHTTESDMAPFQKEASKEIETLGTLLLRYLRREHSYHYLIDRFGRVFRVVEETDAANHAGFSVWSDARGLYVNLNDSFIGVSFEGASSQRSQITAAQVTAARMLTELLRDRYGIAAENCVTHAQVSVNPQNMKLANHMDWAQQFPFDALNLPNNYTARIAAVEAFGFEHDEVLTAAAGRDWPGLLASDKRLREAAAEQGATEVRYRGMLRHRYQEILADLRRQQQTARAGEF